MIGQMTGLLAEEDQDLREEAKKIVKNAAEWLDTPNDQLGGEKPGDLIGTNDEQRVRDLIRAIKHGMFL